MGQFYCDDSVSVGDNAEAVYCFPVGTLNFLQILLFLSQQASCLSSNCYNKTPQNECFKQQTFISHSFGGLEVQGQCASRFGSCWGLSGSLKAAILLSAQMTFVCRCTKSSGLPSSLYKDANPIISKTFMTSSKPKYLPVILNIEG